MKIINKRKVGGFKESTPIVINEEIGQLTEGIFEGSQPIESKKYKGKINNLYFVKIDGVTCSFFGGAILDNRLKDVKVGEGVSITYKGTVPSKTGNPMQDYDVEAGEVVEDDEEEVTPKVTKPQAVKKTAPKKEDTDEGDDAEGDDLPF